MSVTAPDAYEPAPRPARRRFPLLTLQWGGDALEWSGGDFFVRLGSIEVYGRPSRPSAWFVVREPGSVEVAAGWYIVTVARIPTAEGAA